MSNNATLSTFARESPALTRTVNEYATSYAVDVPDAVAQSGLSGGYLRYELTTESGTPRLTVAPSPDVEEYDPNDLLVTNTDALPIPRGIAEATLPSTVTDWAWDGETLSASLSLAEVPDGHIAKGSQRIRTRGDQSLLTLPAVDALAERGACTVRLVNDGGDLAFVVTAVERRADAAPVLDATALPQTPIAPALAAALDGAGDSVPVYVFDESPANTRANVLDAFPATLGCTPPEAGETDEDTFRLDAPEALRDTLDEMAFESGELQVAEDAGTPLLLIDPRESAETTVTRDNDTLCLPTRVARWLGLSRSTIHWHTHDGRLIGEVITDRPMVPADPRGFAGTVADEGDTTRLTLPADAFAEGTPETLGGTVTFSEGAPTLVFSPPSEGDFRLDATPTSDGDITVELPGLLTDLINFTEPAGALVVPDPDGVFAVAMDPDDVQQRAANQPAQAPADAFDNSRLYIPEDGKNAFLRQAGEGNHAVGLPSEAIDQFDLEEGSKFSIQVGAYDGYLALECTPIDDDDVDANVSLGRMLSQTNMRLPIQLVATLSLFDRSITWGLDWGRDGARLIGLVEPMETPPLAHGHDVGEGAVAVSEQSSGSTRHYDVSIPTSAFDVYQDHPPGVFVGFEYIEGDARLVLMPVGEADLDMPGAVKLRDHWEDDADAYLATIPKGLAAAMNVREDERVSWTFLDGQFVGTLASTETF